MMANDPPPAWVREPLREDRWTGRGVVHLLGLWGGAFHSRHSQAHSLQDASPRSRSGCAGADSSEPEKGILLQPLSHCRGLLGTFGVPGLVDASPTSE